MATRDILNYLGEKIGELEEPEGITWSEDEWTSKLEVYSMPPKIDPIPDVTPRQIRQAILLSGVMMSDIDAALNSLPEPTKSFAKIEWEYSTLFIRANPFVTQVGVMLGWNSTQLDNLWKLAKTL